MSKSALFTVRMLSALAGFALLSACGQIPLDENAPARFDLTGHWVQADRPTAERSNASGGDSERRRSGIASGFMAQDFPLLVAQEMRIEQDDRSMGIEYTSGNYRDVTWGERRRGVWEVRAGWNEGALHIYSKASDVSASEIWQLSADGQRLDISISVRGNRDQEFRRVFRRASTL